MMISRSQRPAQGALNQRGGSGGFRPAQMSFISSRSVSFKVCCEQYLFSLPLASAAEHGCAELFVGIDHVGLIISLNRTKHWRTTACSWPTLKLSNAFSCLQFGSMAVKGTRGPFLRLDNYNYCEDERDLIKTVGRAARVQIARVGIESANGQTGRFG